jgi:glutamate N-acetyltransferase/amino-acid N-acetyltransferase
MEKINGGVCAAPGFQAAGAFGGIGKNEEKGDMALILSDTVCNTAAIFTKNKVQGAHIKVSRKHLENGKAQAILCNSGNANTCTADGVEVAEEGCRLVADACGISPYDVLPASTGVIGEPMPIEPFKAGVPKLKEGLSYTGSTSAAKAMMTTDTYPKETAVQFTAGGKTCTIGGAAKGSGMIHPNMGTMLVFITTDCAISPEMIQKALSDEAPASYNQISIDGDTSTNDTVFLMANGKAGNTEITEENADYKAFCEALHEVSVDIARMVAGDGEGATRLIEAHVVHAPSLKAARAVSKSVICSNLVKAAMFAADANWGRILDAIGYTDADFSADNVDVSIHSDKGEITVCKATAAVPFSEEKASEVLGEDAVYVEIDLHDGDFEASAFGCDLTYEYIKINAEYRS